MTRILIAEDEAQIASFLRKGLEANGFTTSVVSDGPTTAEPDECRRNLRAVSSRSQVVLTSA